MIVLQMPCGCEHTNAASSSRLDSLYTRLATGTKYDDYRHPLKQVLTH